MFDKESDGWMYKQVISTTAIPISSSELFTLAKRLLPSGDSNGTHVDEFESELAKYLGSQRVFAFNGGRTALYVALQALRLSPGDEVLVPAYTCAIVFEVVLRLGLKPAFVDVDIDTYNMNPELIPKVLTPRTKAIIPVHLFGQPCDMNKIVEAAEQYGLHIVEDAAQALGAEYKGKKVGTFGDLAVFSFGPGKSITGGEGGAIAVNNPDLLKPVESLQSELPDPDLEWRLHVAKNIFALKIFANPQLYGLVRKKIDSTIKAADARTIKNCASLSEGKLSGLYPTLKPSKMPDTSAAIIAKQLPKLDDFNEKRRINANKLSVLLRDENEKKIRLPTPNSDARSTFTRFALRIVKGDRDLAAKEMLRRNIDAKELYHYITELLQKLSRETFPNAQVLSKSLLALPNHPSLTEDNLTEISSALVSASRAI